MAAPYSSLTYYAPAKGALSDDAVWRLSVWRLSRTSGRWAACAAGWLDGTYWLIGPGSAGLAQGCCCVLPLQAWAYRVGPLPTACLKRYTEQQKSLTSHRSTWFHYFHMIICLQCSDTVDWAQGRQRSHSNEGVGHMV